MQRLDDLQLFLRVLDIGSITGAARSLDISVALASQRLKRLERELGVRLLHRSTRRLHPTPEGAALAERGRALIEDLDALTSGLKRAATSVTGLLRLTTSSTFGRLYISPLLPGFLARYPEVKISVDFNDQVLDLVSEGFDLAIRIGELVDSSLVARQLAVNRRVLCASPEYLRRHGAPRTPADLVHHECLVLGSRHGRRDVWSFTDAQGRTETVHVNGRVECNQGEPLRDAALAGLGIALHSTWHVCHDLQSGRLQVVLPDWRVAESGIYAVMPQRRQVPPRVRAFVDFLVEHLGEVPPWERHLRANDPLRGEPGPAGGASRRARPSLS